MHDYTCAKHYMHAYIHKQPGPSPPPPTQGLLTLIYRSCNNVHALKSEVHIMNKELPSNGADVRL